jgi:hypothetical protein
MTMIQLTEQQRQSLLKGEPVRFLDPELNQELVLCPATLFEHLQEILEDEKDQAAWVKMSMRNLGSRLQEEEDD